MAKFAGFHVPGTRDTDAEMDKDMAGQRAKMAAAGIVPTSSGGYSEHPKEVKAAPVPRARAATKAASLPPGEGLQTAINRRKRQIDDATE